MNTESIDLITLVPFFSAYSDQSRTTFSVDLYRHWGEAEGYAQNLHVNGQPRIDS